MFLIDKKLYHITAAANTYINFSMIYEYYYVIPEEGIIWGMTFPRSGLNPIVPD